MNMRKEVVNLSIFVCNIIAYLQYPKNYIMVIRNNSEFNKKAAYKVHMK